MDYTPTQLWKLRKFNFCTWHLKTCHLSRNQPCMKKKSFWRENSNTWSEMSLIFRATMRVKIGLLWYVLLSFLAQHRSWESCPASVNGAFFHGSDTWDMEKSFCFCGFSTIRIHCKHINVWWMMTPCTVYDNSLKSRAFTRKPSKHSLGKSHKKSHFRTTLKSAWITVFENRRKSLI